MVYFVIGSHASLAGGLVSSLELLIGKRDNVHVINAYVDDDNPEAKLKHIVENAGEQDQCILFSDILGGSIHQLMLKQLQNKNVVLITGYNLATVLEFVVEDKAFYSKDDIIRIVNTGRENLQYIEKLECKDTEDEFF